ncbi:MAG: TolC family protein [FCB group bacterium]|jgi:outer membrane protein TolC
MKKLLIIILVSFYALGVLKADPNEKYLKEYIGIALNKNLALQSSKEMVNVYDAKLSEATANFFPMLNLSGRFTRAGGGRTFVFPLGTMMNPLYEALNMPTRFTDEEVPFIRTQEQDTKLELVQPIINLGIYNNYKAQDDQFESSKYDYKTKELNTVYSVREAYYNYAKALQVVNIRRQSLKLGEESKNIADKLYAVDKAPKTDVLRAEVNLANMQQELQVAVNNATLAGNVFNNILNRELDTPINMDSVSIEEINKPDTKDALDFKMKLDDALNVAVMDRPEIKQMDYGMKSVDHFKDAASSEYYPSLSLVADYGIQGINYVVDKGAAYWMVSGMLSWNLFSGLGTHAKVQEAKAQYSSMERSYESLKALVRLDVKNNYINLKNNLDRLDVAGKAVNSANENYILNMKRYAEGLNPFINLLDAELSMNLAKENYVMVYYDILTARASLEKSIGMNNY